MLVLAVILAICALVCDILVIIKIFQAGEIGLGILAIFCPLFTFIYGWVKSAEWQIRPIMLVWTVIVVINLALRAALLSQGGVSH